MSTFDSATNFQDLTLPNPWGILSWAEVVVHATSSISDAGASGTLGASAIVASVDILTTSITAYGEADAFFPASAAVVTEARGFQAYDIEDANGDPQLVRGTLSIVYHPPTAPGGRMDVSSTLPGNDDGLGVFFTSSMATAGIDEIGLWVQANSPGQPAVFERAVPNAATGGMAATVNFEGVVGAEAINYGVSTLSAATGVFAPAGTPGSYAGAGRFMLIFEESIID